MKTNKTSGLLTLLKDKVMAVRKSWVGMPTHERMSWENLDIEDRRVNVKSGNTNVFQLSPHQEFSMSAVMSTSHDRVEPLISRRVMRVAMLVMTVVVLGAYGSFFSLAIGGSEQLGFLIGSIVGAIYSFRLSKMSHLIER